MIFIKKISICMCSSMGTIILIRSTVPYSYIFVFLCKTSGMEIMSLIKFSPMYFLKAQRPRDTWQAAIFIFASTSFIKEAPWKDLHAITNMPMATFLCMRGNMTATLCGVTSTL